MSRFQTFRSSLLLSVFSLGVLSGCATLSEDECRSADWRTIGYEDGAKGLTPARIGEHRSACAEYGIAPDLSAYRDGHADGVRQYCTSANGFLAGKSGGSYQGVCPEELEDIFLTAFEAGHRLYDASESVRRLESDQRRQENALRDLRQEIRDKENILFSGSTPESQRRSLYEELVHLKSEQRDLQRNLDELDHKLPRARHELQQLESRYGSY